MSISNHSAVHLVRAYLGERSMDDGLFGAVVWVADKRLASGMTPVLDQRLCADIDSQAIAPAAASRRPARTTAPAAVISSTASSMAFQRARVLA